MKTNENAFSQVRTNYDRLTDPSWRVVSADGGVEEVQLELYNIVKECVAKERGEVRRLWVEAGGSGDSDSGVDTETSADSE